MDPLELRRRNHTDVDQVSGLPYSSKHLLACYDRAAELAGWDERDALREPQRRRPAPRHGLRDADLVGRRRPAVARDGPPRRRGPRARRHGHPGHRHRHAHAARRSSPPRSSGCRSTHVRVIGGDTGPNVYGPVAGGSQTTPSVMPAVRSAAAKVRKTLLQLASDVFEIAADDLEVRDGRIRSHDGAHRRRRDRGDGEARQRDDRRLRLARPEPGRLRRQHVRLPDRAGRRRPGPRRGARRADRRRPRRRADRQPADGVEPGRGRRAPGDRRSRSRRSSSSTRPPASRSTRTSTTTRSRRSRTCPRS